MTIPALKLKQLTKRYGSSRGILDVSLEVAPGEVFGFLGPNGAGKTTTIRTILNFIAPTSGTAEILGLDSRRDSVEVKRRVGYLAGDIALYPNLTGRQLLGYLGSLGGGTDWKYVDELAGRLHAELGRKVRLLSKGNQQKIGLIQAFMHRPELLLLDEPTSGLDPLMQEVFYDLVAEAKAAGKAVFVSSHNLPEVQRLCDRAGFIREGKLVAVEEIATISAMSVHKFVVTFDAPVKADDFRRLRGIRVEERSGQVLHFTVEGAADQFIKALAHHAIVDLTEEETSLEEMFMRYYQESK